VDRGSAAHGGDATGRPAGGFGQRPGARARAISRRCRLGLADRIKRRYAVGRARLADRSTGRADDRLAAGGELVAAVRLADAAKLDPARIAPELAATEPGSARPPGR
jgi:hypothetical protein